MLKSPPVPLSSYILEAMQDCMILLKVLLKIFSELMQCKACAVDQKVLHFNKFYMINHCKTKVKWLMLGFFTRNIDSLWKNLRTMWRIVNYLFILIEENYFCELKFMGFHHLANLCYKILKIGWLHMLKSTVIEINHWTKYTNS